MNIYLQNLHKSYNTWDSQVDLFFLTWRKNYETKKQSLACIDKPVLISFLSLVRHEKSADIYTNSNPATSEPAEAFPISTKLLFCKHFAAFLMSAGEV